MSQAAKTAVKEDIRSLSGAERAAVIMLALGEEHSAAIWQMMDEEEIKEISQVMSNLGSVSSSADREAAGRFRLPDVGHRLADGLLRIHRAAARPLHAGRTRSAASWRKSAVPPAAPCGTSSANVNETRARQLSEERISRRPSRWCSPRSSPNMPPACWAPCPRNSRWKCVQRMLRMESGAEGHSRQGRADPAHRIHVQPGAHRQARRP